MKKRNNKNGFTLVELLAVIVILAIILVIAVPKVMSIIEDAKKGTLESTAKMIASGAEKQKVQNTVLGKTKEITCDSVAKINNADYSSCSITFDGNIAKVTIEGSGKFEGLWVCDGTKTSAEANKESCIPTAVKYIEGLLGHEETLNNGLVQTTATYTNEDDEEITLDAGIRYAGAIHNVKNKVYFNCKDTDANGVIYGDDNYNYVSSCELWRIIGVFDTKKNESDTTSVKRVKIVRDEVLSTNMAWDTFDDEIGENHWGETTLKDGTPYSGASLKQYLNGTTEGNYYYSLSNITKNQIAKVLWYTGAMWGGTKEDAYVNERGNDIYTKDSTVNYTTTWVGKIGLIYPSDFGYAGKNCGDKTLYDYRDSCGTSNNWLRLTNANYWTLTYDKNYGSIFTVWSSGFLSSADSGHNRLRGVRPSLYLKSDIKIIDGNGNDKPYILAM